MRINRFSIYDTFGNKHDLFLKALERYREQMTASMLRDLANSADGLPAIRRYFDLVVEHLTSPEGRKACLMINSIAEKAAEDQKIRSRCLQNVKQLEGALRKAVVRAQDHGEIDSRRDPQEVAEYLATNVMGLNVLAKADRRRQRLIRNVEVILGTL